jgi:hypothetical protein
MEQEMNFEPAGRLGAATAISFLIAASAGQARADCGPLPKVPWWGNARLSRTARGSEKPKKINFLLMTFFMKRLIVVKNL